MSEHSTKTPQEGKESGEQSSSEEGSSHSRSEASSKSKSSIWSRILRLIKPAHGGERLREDLADAINDDTEIGDAFSPSERAMLNNILRFREVRVEDIMIPRSDIDALDQSMTLGEALIRFESNSRSRMPVYDENLDNARGMVHIRDLLSYIGKEARNKRRGGSRNNGADTPESTESKQEAKANRTPRKSFDLARVDLDKSLVETGVIRNIIFAPQSMLASEMLRMMQEQRTQLALIIDEYGGTDGLVSHEDIVEMVVGDIEDEHDFDDVTLIKVNDDVFEVEARTELAELADAIGHDFDVSAHVEEIDTLGGLIFFSHGSIPSKGDVVHAVDGFAFHILDADYRRIKKVRIVRYSKDGMTEQTFVPEDDLSENNPLGTQNAKIIEEKAAIGDK